MKRHILQIENNNNPDNIKKQLKDSEAKLRSIFKAAPIGIGMVSNRIIKEANDKLCEMLGYARDELVEQSARILGSSGKCIGYCKKKT